MKILITGGAGFIGSHLAHNLIAQGHTVYILDDLSTGLACNIPNSAIFINASVTDKASYEVHLPDEIDVIYHLAASVSIPYSIKHPVEDTQITIMGTINMLELAREYSAHMIFPSTASLYEGCSMPATESGAHKGSSPYSVSKFAAEAYIRMYADTYGVTYTIFRFANVYGHGQRSVRLAGVISAFLEKISLGEPLRIFAGGKQVRDYVFITDIVNALVSGMSDKCQNDTFNLGTGTGSSVNDILEVLRSLHGELETVFEDNYISDIDITTLDSTKIYKKVGWKPTIDLKTGISALYREMMKAKAPQSHDLVKQDLG